MARRDRLLRWIEFAALFLLMPVLIAIFLPPRMMFAALFLFSLLGLVLLAISGDFDWRSLGAGWRNLPFRDAALMGLAIILFGAVLLGLTRPEALFMPLRTRPQFLLMIAVLYPILSALPQELLFRALFFHRYGALMPSDRVAMLVNAGVFAFAHLLYWNPVTLLLTAIGGWLFARAYLTRGFAAAWFMHAIAGNLVFAAGLGMHFYSGIVRQPF